MKFEPYPYQQYLAEHVLGISQVRKTILKAISSKIFLKIVPILQN